MEIMAEKKYRVHDLVKFQYSEIGEYVGENYTDRPLRNDEIVDLLNELHEENEGLKIDNKQLVQFIMSKGYELKDYLAFIGQFQSIGVKKEDWE